MLYIRPLGGLANRLRVLASALSLSSDQYFPLCCIWPSNDELGARFEDLFQPIPSCSFTDLDPFLGKPVVTHNRSLLGTRLSILRNQLTAGLDFVVDERKCGWEESIEYAKTYAGMAFNRRILISTYQDFHDLTTGLGMINLIPSLSSRVADSVRVLNKSSATVGIHVRRGDNLLSAERSPLDHFVSSIQQILLSNADTIFYLSTDSPQVVEHLRLLFGDKVFSPPRHYSRDTVCGVQDAAVDLFTLASCDLILGSFWSSFSALASRIGNSKLHILDSTIGPSSLL